MMMMMMMLPSRCYHVHGGGGDDDERERCFDWIDDRFFVIDGLVVSDGDDGDDAVVVNDCDVDQFIFPMCMCV